jgi:hypothetical protein
MNTKTKVETSAMDSLTYARRFNAVVRGTATYDAVSNADKVNDKAKHPRVFTVGDKVAADRASIAVYNGLSYNANLAREKAYRKGGIALLDLPMGKRGRTINTDSINAALAEDATAEELAAE